MIRKAELKDIETLFELSKELGSSGIIDDNTIKRISKIINTKKDHLLVYDFENKVLGWVHFFVSNRVTGSFVEIGGIVVSPDFRRKGIGRKLVEEVISYSRKQELKARVRCNSKRLGSHGFYKEIGFLLKKSQCVFEL